MDATVPVYMGRVVHDLANFRVFVFGVHGNQKLVESWDEYCAHKQLGVWFDSPEEAQSAHRDAQELVDELPVLKPKSRKKNAAVDETVLALKD